MSPDSKDNQSLLQSIEDQLPAVEKKYQQTGHIIYYDRRIWEYRNPDTGEIYSTVDLIRKQLQDPEITEDQIIVTQPEASQSLGIPDIFASVIVDFLKEGKVPRSIVIPRRTKAEDAISGNTIWLNVSREWFAEIGERIYEKTGVPIEVYQLGVGKIFPFTQKSGLALSAGEIREHEPKPQGNIKCTIVTVDGKVISVDSSVSAGVYFSPGSFSQVEVAQALADTFPDWEHFTQRPPQLFQKEESFEGFRLGVDLTRKGVPMNAVWIRLHVGPDDRMEKQMPENWVKKIHLSLDPDGNLVEYFYSKALRIQLQHESVYGWDNTVNEGGQTVNLHLSEYVGNITPELVDSQPEELEVVKAKLPQFLTYLLRGDTIGSICVSQAYGELVYPPEFPAFSQQFVGFTEIDERVGVEFEEPDVVYHRIGGHGYVNWPDERTKSYVALSKKVGEEETRLVEFIKKGWSEDDPIEVRLSRCRNYRLGIKAGDLTQEIASLGIL